MNRYVVTYQTALKLKDLGYNEECNYIYKGGQLHRIPSDKPFKNSHLRWSITAPYAMDAFLWLVEEYNKDISYRITKRRNTLKVDGKTYTFEGNIEEALKTLIDLWISEK